MPRMIPISFGGSGPDRANVRKRRPSRRRRRRSRGRSGPGRRPSPRAGRGCGPCALSLSGGRSRARASRKFWCRRARIQDRRGPARVDGDALAAALHLTSGSAFRTDETTSRIARVVAAASTSSTISEMWVAPAMARCTLLVDKVAMSFCAADQAASLPLPAVRTTKGLSAKSHGSKRTRGQTAVHRPQE
jgi:hypothetical protein